MTGTKPAVTVVVPVYNDESTVAAALSSIEAQTWANTTAIVVDDGSTDQSAAIIAPVCDRRGWKFLSQPNLGTGFARNLALDSLETEYVTFLDADDILYPTALESAMITMLGQAADMVLCTNHVVGWHGLPTLLPALGWMRQVTPNWNARLHEETCLGHPPPTSKLFSHNLLQQNDIRFRLADHGEEIVFNAETWVAASTIAVDTSPFYLRRPKNRITPGLTDNKGTIHAVRNILRAVGLVEQIAHDNQLHFVHWHNRHIGFGHVMENIGFLPVDEKRAGIRLLESTVRSLGLDPSVVKEYIGVSIEELNTTPVETISHARCRYWVVTERLRRGIQVVPHFDE